jgi:hypothetical protein
MKYKKGATDPILTPSLSIEPYKSPAELFMQLCRIRTPYGSEIGYWHNALSKLGFAQDAVGNYHLTIGQSQTLFTAHLDTVGEYGEALPFSYKGIAYSNGDDVLGADDRAGVALILWMVRHGKPGRYALFLGEEKGCLGSRFAAGNMQLEGIKAVVSLDRRGTSSIITHQSGQRTASDMYALALAEALAEHGVDMLPDDGGIYSDSFSFIDVVGECTNLSVGYKNAHTSAETQDLHFLNRLGHALLMVDFDGLPFTRQPGEVDLEDFAWYGYYSYTLPDTITDALADDDTLAIDKTTQQETTQTVVWWDKPRRKRKK